MEVIAFILFIVLMIANVNSKAKKKGNAAAKPGTPAKGGRQAPDSQVQPEQPARPKTPFSAIPTDLDDLINEVKSRAETILTEASRRSEPVVQAMDRKGVREGEGMLADPDCAGGSMEHAHTEGHSALEDEDCAGGSMEHSHTEGVSRTAHAKRMAAIDANRGEEVLPETIDARALRRAVVMAEVLGKPRAMRRI